MRAKFIALLLASAVPALALSACKGATDGQTEQAAANPSGLDLAAMDKAVKPGDDFFSYANGAWFKNSEIPADRSSIGAFFITQQELEKRMDTLMADIGKSDAAAGSNERKVADYTKAFMDRR
jgi:predicted metalloendopeptidase